MDIQGGNHKSQTAWMFLLIAGLLCCAGCGGSKSESVAKSNDTKTAPPVQPTVLQNGIPTTPQAAMNQMVAGLRENRPAVIWQSMPVEFQREINGLVREFAKKMDPKLWRQSFAVWTKLASLLSEKKSAILSDPSFADLSAAQRRQLAQNWDGLVELLTILVQSDLSDLAQLRSFDMGRFLERTGGKWLSQLAALSKSLGQDSLSGMLAGLTPKTLFIEGDKAKMAWITADSTEPVSEFLLIKVENRWVPAGWVKAWEQVREWRLKLREEPAESFSIQTEEKLKTLARVDQKLTALISAKSDEDFQRMLGEELGEPNIRELAALIRTLSGAPSAIAPVVQAEPASGEILKTANDANSVTLIINSKTDSGDEDVIFDEVQAALPGDVDVQFERGKSSLKVIVGPVADLDQFRQRIRFGKILKHDDKQRTIEIDMNR